jgi:hypothetical protein
MSFILPPLIGANSLDRPAIALGIQGGVAVADDPVGFSSEFFTTKVQIMGALNALLDVPVLPSLSIGIGMQLHGIRASSLAGGWSYKSHWGGGIRLSTAYGSGISEPSQPLQLELGTSIGASLNFDLETWTTLFFFYPGVFLEPYLQLNSSRRKNCSTAIVLPIDYFFRRDLELYGSIGLGVLWRYTLK